MPPHSTDYIDYTVEDWRSFFLSKIRNDHPLISRYLSFVGEKLAQGLPPIFEINHLCLLTGVEKQLLGNIIRNSEAFYREFSIPKRSGGERIISVPNPTLMYMQRWIKLNILDKIEPHECAHGYVAGKSIRSNAILHINSSFIVKLDLLDFFPSIKTNEVVSEIENLNYPPSVSYAIGRICTLKDALPQGAPTSPSISNLVFRKIDSELNHYCQREGLNYSRYADDITFSGPKFHDRYVYDIRSIINCFDFQLNEKKTRIIRRGKRAIVTGISVTNGELRLPRSQVREIKRDVHFLLRNGFAAHSKNRGINDPFLLERLIGKLYFWKSIEPENENVTKMIEKMKNYLNDISAEWSIRSGTLQFEKEDEDI